MEFRFAQSTDADFLRCSEALEAYLNEAVGGAQKRAAFAPFNVLEGILDILLAYDADKIAACACLKPYDAKSLLVKRVWVFPEYRGRHIGRELLIRLEERALERGYTVLLLQTRRECRNAILLYESLGYVPTENFPPYEGMLEALCYQKCIG